MKLMWGSKDGGPESHVTCYGFESKRFFSVLLLRFTLETRENFHNHAFDCWNMTLSGKLGQQVLCTGCIDAPPHWTDYVFPRYFKVSRGHFHRAFGVYGVTWILSFRGPWRTTWKEYDPNTHDLIILTHGRKEVSREVK